MLRPKIATLVALTGLLISASCSKIDDPSIINDQGLDIPAPPLRTTAHNLNKNLYWGDLHVHSSLSYDAYTMGVRSLPEDAYTYMKGGTIEHGFGYNIRAKRALDFGAVTDHAEYLNVPSYLDKENRNQENSKNSLKETVRAGKPLSLTYQFFKMMLESMGAVETRDATFNKPELKPVSLDAWQQIIDAAEKHNAPGRFTTFIAYEWSSMPDAQNLHRNVIYRGNAVPSYPYSSLDSENPEDLWDELDQQRALGMDNLAIPHNANVSNGLMYDQSSFEGEPLSADYATQRNRNEPISEIIQVKGTSETHPQLSPDDEFADFSIYDNALSTSSEKPEVKGAYVRDALRTGIELSKAQGFNPYRFGFIGSSDGHNASSPVEEDNYHGKLPILDGSAGIRLGETLLIPDEQNRGRSWFAQGLAAVWAEENTRDSIFSAIRNKETYATSGPRISLRFFAGYSLESTMLDSPDVIEQAYARGVPMGSALNPSQGKSPRFLIIAQKDPIGANLDRIQIIKGWVDADGNSHEKIYDVAASDGRTVDEHGQLPAVGNTVDIDSASYTNTIGDEILSALWQDPNFEPSQQAFYYVRAIEIPTPKWSTYDAKLLGIPAPEPSSIQERAISSAIWYTP